MDHKDVHVTVGDHPDASRFEIHVDGELAGFIDYERRGQLLRMVHTEVDPAFRGMGIGDRLARGAIEAARQEGTKVVPICPFLATWFDEHPDFAAVRATDDDQA